MEVIEFVSQYGPWSWVVAGLVLLAIELIAPGGVFVWFGGAAVITGLVTLGVNIGWPLQWAIFGVLSLAGLAGWLAIRRRNPAVSESPLLNQRSERMVGKHGFLSEPIIGGTGRMEFADSVWRVTGPNLPVGHQVRVTGHKGSVLQVESAESERIETA